MKYLGMICLLFLFVACAKEEKTQTYYHGFTNQTWEVKTPIKFEFEISDTSKEYNLETEFRYDERFNFNALKLNCSLLSPSGSSRFRKTKFDIHNDDGSFAGAKNEGFMAITQALYKKIKFNEKGKWTLNVTHSMPMDIERGLVGLEFELSEISGK